jgi:glycosyltransferase involved in cell wall biosynthesis
MSIAEDNPKGFWEDNEVTEVNKKILTAAGVNWYGVMSSSVTALPPSTLRPLISEAEALMLSRLQRRDIWGFKDPRTCRTLPVWKKAFANAKIKPRFIIALRNPLAVAASLQKRDGLPFELSIVLWAQHIIEAVCESSDSKRLVVEYQNLLTNPRAELERIAGALCEPLSIDEPKRLADYCDGFLDNSLNNHDASIEMLEEHEKVPDFVKELYCSLRLVADDTLSIDSPRIKAAIKEARTQCEVTHSMRKVVNVISRHLVIKHSELGLHKQTVRIQELENRSQELENRSQELENRIQELESELSSSRLLVEQYQNDLHRVNQESINQALRIRALYRSKSWRLTAPMRKSVNWIRSQRASILPSVGKLIRWLWRRLPGSASKKESLRRFIARYFPQLVRIVASGTHCSEGTRFTPIAIRSGPLVGRIERIDGLCICGWLMGSSSLAAPLLESDFSIKVNREIVPIDVRVVARDDVDKSYGVSGSVGFYVDLPEDLADGEERQISIDITSSGVTHSLYTLAFSRKSPWRVSAQGGKKILFCSHNLRSQGAQHSLYEMAVGLKTRYGIQPVVYSPEDGELRSLYERVGIHVIIEPSARVENFVAENWDREIEKLANKVRLLECTAVIANTLKSFQMIHVAKALGLRSVFIPRESEEPKDYFNYLHPRLREKAYQSLSITDKLVFVANATREVWHRFNPNLSAEVIHNSLNLAGLLRHESTGRAELRAGFGIKPTEQVLLSVGTVSERKGQVDFVKALPQLLERHSSLKAILVGMVDADGTSVGEYNQEIRARLCKLPQTQRERVILIPETDTLRVTCPRDFYSIADVFVFTSRIESFPRVVLEAMYHGLPIVTTPCFGVVEQCVEDYNSIFYPAQDVKSLIAAIEKLIEDPNERSRLSKNSLKLFGHMQSYEKMLSRYYELVDDTRRVMHVG